MLSITSIVDDMVDTDVSMPSGNEIGPFRAVEESTLAHLTHHDHLSDIFAWYSLIGTAGTALGMITCGWIISWLQTYKEWEYIPAARVIFYLYAIIGGMKLFFSLALTSKVEAEKKNKDSQREEPQQQEPTETEPLLANAVDEPPAQPKRRKIPFLASLDKHVAALFVELSILFALDAFASGLAPL